MESKGSLSQAKEDAALFNLPATAANKPLPINEPEVIQIFSAFPLCHQCSQQPPPQTQLASSKSAQVHTKQQKHNAKNQVSHGDKICSPAEPLQPKLKF